VSGGLAIFVKTPGRSPIKTRLAANLGEAAALEWYECAAAATAEVAAELSAMGLATCYWAVAEPEALDDPQWSSLPRLGQGDGGLGARMARVHDALVARHGRGLLIGADAPQLQAAELIAADRWLQGDEARIALGPASDGGFWLVGANRSLPLVDWIGVPYSCADTGAEFRRAMQPHGRWQEVATLTDVDVFDDLPTLAQALQRLAQPLPQQRRLLQLTRSLLSVRSTA
jgi:hypothetical protein